jgi:hypothetical protein
MKPADSDISGFFVACALSLLARQLVILSSSACFSFIGMLLVYAMSSQN